MSVSVSTFRTAILPYVHDCPDIAADVAARFAIREFCKLSDWLQFEHDPITVIAGQADYELEPPDQTQVFRVIEASYDERRIRSVTVDELRGKYIDWRTRTGTPIFITAIAWPTARLVPVPDEKLVNGLTMICSIEPVVDATLVDETLYARWSEIIGYGARARLKLMSGQPYYDPTGSAVDRGMFMKGVSAAILERQRSFGRGVQTVQMRKW